MIIYIECCLSVSIIFNWEAKGNELPVSIVGSKIVPVSFPRLDFPDFPAEQVSFYAHLLVKPETHLTILYAD